MIRQGGENIAIFSAALNKIADNVMITDCQGTIEYVNPAFEATTGYKSSEAVGQTPRLLRSGRHDSNYYQSLWQIILAGKVFRATTINKKKNGDIYYADQTISPVLGEAGEVRYFISVWKDITERILAQEKLSRLSEQLTFEKKKLEQVLSIEALLHSISDLHKLIDFVIDRTCEVLEVKKCSIMFIDDESRELCLKGSRGIEESRMGENLRMGDQIEDLIELHRPAGLGKDSLSKSHGSLRIDGTVYRSETFMSAPILMGEHLLGIVNISDKKEQAGHAFDDLDLKILLMIVRQIKVAIENARLYRNLKYLTVVDPLTGIYNYRYLTQILDYEIARLKRYQRDLSLLMMDVDKFKSYNNDGGHPEGDKLLKAVGQTVKQCMRNTDSVCRCGKDEFAVILPETNLAGARIAAEKIGRKIVELPARRPVTVSIGIAQCASRDNRHDLLHKAEGALYAAKQKGSNQISQGLQ